MSNASVAPYSDKRQIFGWACYDWANSAFATTIIAGMFPIFFKDYWSTGLEATESSFWLGLSNSTASLIIALLAPILGAMADAGTGKKRFLALFTFIGTFTTCGLYLVEQGAWQAACIVYIIARIGFQGSMVFYDALLMNVSNEKNRESVSAMGFAAGYLGGGLQFMVCVIMVTRPDFFGLVDHMVGKDSAEYKAAQLTAVQLSFIFTGVWWLLWSIPTFALVKEQALTAQPQGAIVRRAFSQLAETFRSVRQYKTVALFLLAYWLYIDGVHTVVTMAVDFGKNQGLASDKLILALLITQFVGFPATLLFGFMGQRYGAKPMILFAIGVYIITVIIGSGITEIWEFYVMAVVIGLVQGNVQSNSRALYASIIPPEKASEFFGFYNMLGKFASVLGPVMFGGLTALTGNPKVGFISIALLLILGGLLLSRVKVNE